MMQNLLKNIASQQQLKLISTKTLAGGDINQVFLLKCCEGNFVVKLNNATKFPKMFSTEAKGLQLLKNGSRFKIPQVIDVGEVDNISYLLMEYIFSGNPETDFWQLFAKKLAGLHKNTQANFGLDHDNYIGSLPQKNGTEETASEFYINQRLEPQFKIAYSRGFHFLNLHKFYRNISLEIPNEPPALIHGDLWSGNFMVSEKGKPVLIDPAIAFAPREMDLAMMQLFGGFSEEVFSIYQYHFPLETGWKERTSLWQLYYLLVHLNLFGENYLSRVKFIVDKYS